MKINEVEQLTGIPKKNIRFYEEQGLVQPGRDKSNGYREYGEADVERLLEIRLLRRLGVPIEEIRRLQEGRLSLRDCMERHLIGLNREKQNLELISGMCKRLAEEESSLSGPAAEKYLGEILQLEKEGTRFMNVAKTDVSKKKRGARTAGYVMIALVVLWDASILYGFFTEAMPLGVLLVMTLPATAVIVGICIALRERIKEIEGGEEDEALHY